MLLRDIEQRAEEVLGLFGKRNIPVPVETIAEHFNLRIGKAPSDAYSGLLLRRDGTALIGVNDSESPRRQRFTIAHELGHFFLHPYNEAFVDYRKSVNKPRTPKEREADVFAAALLMPRKEIAEDFTKTISGINFDQEHFQKHFESAVTVLATKYDVSDDAMRIRLMTLNASV